ncbi:MAG TPA: hypothetical protein DHV28_16330 [Ignavibacteriales bacterium]|nr:hypothetical protein [Ignavibacteriales bacterium]
MERNLINFREQLMDSVDQAVDKTWPTHVGDDFVREMQWAVDELINICNEMKAKGISKLEQSRTYRYLGNVYSDLEPALGKQMLLKAIQTYKMAELLLKDQSDEFEKAKLNFNYGNTLRQIDPDNIELLQESRQRILSCRAYFAENETNYLAQVDKVLNSVEDLLRIAPLANAVKKKSDGMANLNERLQKGDNISDVASKMNELMMVDGGPAGMLGQLQVVVDTINDDQKQTEKYKDIQKQMPDLTKQVLDGGEMSHDNKQIWSLLEERLKSDSAKGKVSEDRVKSLSRMMEDFGKILSSDENDLRAMQAKQQKMKEFIAGKFEMTHYLSHGIERPPDNSRAAELVELNWQLRCYLMEELSRTEKGEEESKEIIELYKRTSVIDKRIYEVGADNKKALIVVKEELRPLSLEVRNFSSRFNTMPARPLWKVMDTTVDTNAIFFSGTENTRVIIEAACQRIGLKIMREPTGETYTCARWIQLQKSITTIFDLRVTDGPGMAQVNYELGMALTLGKPIVILVAEGQVLPFDVEIEPIALNGGNQDVSDIATAIDRSMVWIYPRLHSNESLVTLEYVLSLYNRPQQNIYADQMLRMLIDLQKIPDSLAIMRTLVKFYQYLNDGEVQLIHPRWSPAYPEKNEKRLFHVTPFKTGWPDRVKTFTRKICKTVGVKYIRDDDMSEPNIILSIWKEISRATHILVDLTDYNANVALELGIAHTLGKKILLLGQGNPNTHIFKSISKFRIKSYDINKMKETLGVEIQNFITTIN